MSGRAARVRRTVDGIDSRWKNAPIRTRLTGAAAFAATFAIVAVVAVAYIAVHHELYSNIDGQLRAQAHSAHSIRVDPLSLQPQVVRDPGESSGNVQVVDGEGHKIKEPGGLTLPASARDAHIAADGGTWLRTVNVGGSPMRILTVQRSFTSSNGERVALALQVALPLTTANSELHKLKLAFLFLVLLGFAMATVGTSFVVRRTMRPVARLTEAAEEIARTRDLATRIEDYGGDELGRLASTFNAMLDALERSLGQQRQLILDSSHELRTPLASLRTNVEVLHDVDRLSVEQRRALLEGIVTQLDELTALVADVVELARGDVPEAAFEELSFDELVAHAVDRAQRHWPNVAFDYLGEAVTVRGVPARLDRAVANLLDNAGKFSAAGSEVEVRLTSDGVLTVADRGPGIPDEAIGQVFDRFYRADEARALPGSGLGLSIVKQVADGHGGTVTVANRPSGGTIVTLSLPVPGGVTAAAPVVAAAQEPEPVS
ncbi:MAG TPA: HAMP domain-containing sensor histidine kinase [Mycobacteriales bacterium]|jgi:two-component system sensor histidine kinase MprB|nr:HAMP domain-containing sensor histidine kinase [Mycobacteriales bacterium]